MTDYYTKEETLDQHQQMVDAINRNLDEKMASLNKKADQILRVFNIISTALKITDETAGGLAKRVGWLTSILIFVAIVALILKGGFIAVIHAIARDL